MIHMDKEILHRKSLVEFLELLLWGQTPASMGCRAIRAGLLCPSFASFLSEAVALQSAEAPKHRDPRISKASSASSSKDFLPIAAWIYSKAKQQK